MTLNVLQCSLIEKAGYENGFENNELTENSAVCLSSARHPARVFITPHIDDAKMLAEVRTSNTASLIAELARSFSGNRLGDDLFLIANISELAIFLHRTSALAQSLPNQLVEDYEKQVEEKLNGLGANKIQATEIERIVRQRIGQQKFREAMLEYWEGACAVTGIDLPEVLRASHAKPWAECLSDSQRLDVFNGFLLCANLDALFDRFLISFDDTGQMLISAKLDQIQRDILGLNKPLGLRWLANGHSAYLDYHRSKFLELQSVVFDL